MPVKVKFLIIAGIFAVASSLIIYVTFSLSDFWLLIPGVAGVAIFGPWSYYLYAKTKEPSRLTHDEIIEKTRIEMKEKGENND